MALNEDLAERIRVILAGTGSLREVRMFGGLCFMLVGRVPARGEIIEHPHGLTFEILEADQRRIRRLRIRRAALAGGSGNVI